MGSPTYAEVNAGRGHFLQKNAKAIALAVHSKERKINKKTLK